MHQQNTGQEGESSPYFPLRTTQSAVSFQGNKYTISLQSYSPCKTGDSLLRPSLTPTQVWQVWLLSLQAYKSLYKNASIYTVLF